MMITGIMMIVVRVTVTVFTVTLKYTDEPNHAGSAMHESLHKHALCGNEVKYPGLMIRQIRVTKQHYS